MSTDREALEARQILSSSVWQKLYNERMQHLRDELESIPIRDTQAMQVILLYIRLAKADRTFLEQCIEDGELDIQRMREIREEQAESLRMGEVLQ